MNHAPVEIIVTEDGSPTLYFPEYGQAMHTLAGAYTESLVKHVYPSRVLERADSPVTVLDVGFGLGYNILALVTEMRRKSPAKPLSIVSFERDLSYAPMLEKIDFDDDRGETYGLIKKSLITGTVHTDMLDITVLTGDAREKIHEVTDRRFDAVFHDPFSPSRNPELWSLEFFRLLLRVMKDDAILTTYSSAAQVRRAMLEAGFTVGSAPSMGNKREGTLASPGRHMEPLGEGEIRAMYDNYKSTPYRDPGLCSGREDILNRRIAEMKEARVRAYRPAHQK